jgi:hypothetical protein
VEVGKSAQEYIDRGNQAILENMLENASPRHFIRGDGSVNEEEYADRRKKFIHVDGNLGQDSILPVQGKVLSDVYLAVLNNKVDELKETTGNRDISNGGTTSGVTAASAIAAMQEAGSKLSRDSNKASYRAFRKVCLMILELIRQFYDMPRCFRILGRNGAAEYVEYSNLGLRPQAQGNALGVDMGYRVPLFDIEITAQKASPYAKMSQNELALQFFGAGFFNPQLADQALACLDMMDFDRKEFVIGKIADNAGLYRKLRELALTLDGLQGTDLAGELERSMTGPGGTVKPGRRGGSLTEKARKRVADSTAPR